MLLTLRILHVVPEEGSRSALPPPTRSTASFHYWSSFLYCYSFFLILRKFRHLHRESKSRGRGCSEAVRLQVWGSLQTLIEWRSTSWTLGSGHRAGMDKWRGSSDSTWDPPWRAPGGAYCVEGGSLSPRPVISFHGRNGPFPHEKTKALGSWPGSYHQ